MVCIQGQSGNKVNMMDEGTARSICGPYEQAFLSKFRGRQVKSLSLDRLKLQGMPVQTATRHRYASAADQNMLPKLKELQKIAKSERRRPPKLHKYLDGISDLELYITNKLMNNLSTRQIVGQLSRNIEQETANHHTLDQNYMRMTVPGAQGIKFHMVDEQDAHQNRHQQMARTDYHAKDKWLTDRDFVNKFDSFIVKRKDEEDASAKEEAATIPEATSENQVSEQIAADKQHLTKIARRMIEDQNLYEEENEVEEVKALVAAQDPYKLKQPRTIAWIMKECSDYEKKFTISKSRKVKAKSTVKSLKRLKVPNF